MADRRTGVDRVGVDVRDEAAKVPNEATRAAIAEARGIRKERRIRSAAGVPATTTRSFDEAAARLSQQNRFEGSGGASEIEMLEEATGLSRGR